MTLASSEVAFESDGVLLRVAVYGFNQFKKELKNADASMRKAMDAEIRAILTPVAEQARGFVQNQPLRNWGPPSDRVRTISKSGSDKGWGNRIAYDAGNIRKGIKVLQGGRRAKTKADSSAWKISNTSGAGIILETAGRLKSGKGVAGENFIKALTMHNGSPSRLIWRAWDNSGGENNITRSIVDVVHKYEDELQRLLAASD